MKRIVITGATGMIGANLAKYASAQGCEVLCIIRPDSPKEDNIPKNDKIHIQYAPLSDYENITVNKEYDTFYHFAWEKTFGASRDDVDSQLQNIKYTLDAVRLAKRLGCKAFIGAGSQAEYGIVDTDLRPDTPVNPLSGYGIAKYTSGKLSQLLCSQLGIRHNWVRILSVYGALDNPYTLIMYTINALLKGQPTVFSPCQQIWDYIHEIDAAKAFFAIGEKGLDQKIYPLGSGQGRPLYDYLEQIKELVSPHASLGFGQKDYYPNQPMHLCADLSELTADTGWKPQISFTEGIKQVLSQLATHSIK